VPCKRIWPSFCEASVGSGLSFGLHRPTWVVYPGLPQPFHGLGWIDEDVRLWAGWLAHFGGWEVLPDRAIPVIMAERADLL
jgi:hypothetical protein